MPQVQMPPMTNPKWLRDYPILQDKKHAEYMIKLGWITIIGEVRFSTAHRFESYEKQVRIWLGLNPHYYL